MDAMPQAFEGGRARRLPPELAMLRVTNEDVPLPYAANLEKLALIKADDVVKAAKAVSYR